MNKRKLLIAGGAGFVGGHLVLQARQRWNVHILDRELRQGLPSDAMWHLQELINDEQIVSCVHDVQPNVIIIAAAISDIDLAEVQPNLAYDINVTAARNLALAGQAAGAQVVYLSSDAVYNGQADCVDETRTPDPVNVYGKTKRDGEIAVTEVCPGTLILRLSLVLGRALTRGNSFVDKLEDRLRSGETITSNVHEIRTPVDVVMLADTILKLVETHASGVYHIGSRDSMSRYEITQRLAEAMGFSSNLILKNDRASKDNQRAPRHKKGILSVQKIEKFLGIKMPSTEETIRRAVYYPIKERL